MEYYAVQVKTGYEPDLLTKIQKIADTEEFQNVQAYFPRRVLYIRKQGIQKKIQAPVFPGYLFLQTAELPLDLFLLLRKMSGFYRFLPNNQNPLPLADNDLSILQHFLSFGEIVHPSKVYFDENERICIIEGPLKGLEGKIIKVDKRKQRAKVLLNMYTDSFPIDLSFELIQPARSSSS